MYSKLFFDHTKWSRNTLRKYQMNLLSAVHIALHPFLKLRDSQYMANWTICDQS